MAKELKTIKAEVEKFTKNSSQVSIIDYNALVEELKGAKNNIERLMNENNLLKISLEDAQNNRVMQNKTIMALEEKLKRMEKNMKHCEDTRYKLSIDIQALQSNMQRLSKKLLESDSVYQSCLNFIEPVSDFQNIENDKIGN